MPLVEKEYTASQTHDNYTPADNVSVFGGEEDLWGAEELTPEQINDPNFAIKFDADLGAGLLRVDDVKVEVFYEIPLPPTANEEADALPPWADKGLLCGCIGTDANGLLQFAVAGRGGVVKTSPDGENWTDRETGIGDTLRGIDFDPSSREFVAVGDNGAIVSSADGIVWDEEESDTNASLLSTVWSPVFNNFVTVGAQGAIRTRKDSVWQQIQF